MPRWLTASLFAVVLISLVAVAAGVFTFPATGALRPTGLVASKLPLVMATGDAQQVITVVASSPDATSAELQAWQEAPGGAWAQVGTSTIAHTAAGGITDSPSEGIPATPSGSFSITEAFGKVPNPGTRLAYFQTTAADWWISQPGPLYNTHQTCIANCPFETASPNARLTDPLRAYNVAIVIDYNRFPVVQGAGSAYFLHVTTAGQPTRGCIAIPQASLVLLMRWLDPSKHPRIMIGIE